MSYPFNVRVYGLWVNDAQQVLVADELIHGREITKFPGGGLEFGESTIDCLLREMMEETGTTVEVIAHFYTTDFFQASAFNSKAQVISIYYRIRPLSALNVRIANKPFDFDERKEGAISFRFISLKDISEEDFTFPIDKRVAVLLRNKKTEK
jgi:8-oxo-dGTP diphosphatase